MCGIFGILVEKKINKSDFKKLALLSRERGKDSSGFLTHCKKKKNLEDDSKAWPPR
jgi:asparagine synthetase B (glutamine-hydrolysing)